MFCELFEKIKKKTNPKTNIDGRKVLNLKACVCLMVEPEKATLKRREVKGIKGGRTVAREHVQQRGFLSHSPSRTTTD